MRLLDRYLALTLLKSYFLVLLMLLSLFCFVELIEQLEDVGKGRYQLVDAVHYVVWMIPRRIVELAPFTVLLGSLLGLGSLATHQEIIAMQSAGMSPSRIGLAVLTVTVIVMTALLAIDEWIAPPFHQQAERLQMRKLYGKGQFNSSGFWSRQGLQFIHVQQLQYGYIPSKIHIYEFDGLNQLRNVIYSETAEIIGPNRWRLHEVIEKHWVDRQVITRRAPQQEWQSFLTQDDMRLLEPSAASLPLSDLYRYIQYLHNSGQRARPHELAFWQKIARPITTAALVFLAIPFTFGLSRQIGIAKRLVMGLLIGIVFHVGQQIVINIGLLLHLPVSLVTLLPAMGILLAAALVTSHFSPAAVSINRPFVQRHKPI